ncbi:unnamed protein product [Trichobilharzia szidati]|nr:unnamed protein product [Trichobilharzia szidati]
MRTFNSTHKRLYEIIYSRAQMSKFQQHNSFISNNFIWMAIYSRSLNVYLVTLTVIYMPFISYEKSLNNTKMNPDKQQLMTSDYHNLNYPAKVNQTRLTMIERRKRLIKASQNYSEGTIQPSFNLNYGNSSTLRNIRKQPAIQEPEFYSPSGSYFSSFRPNFSSVSTNGLFSNFSKTSYSSYSSPSKLPSKPSSSVAEVTDEPDFDHDQPVYITSVKNSTAVLPCKVKNIDFSSTVMSWWKEDLPMPLTVGNEISLPRYEIDRTNPESWTLMIFQVTEADSGTYICQINLADIKEKFFYLKVIAHKTEPDATKLNDEYVKDDTIQNTLWRASSKRKSVHIISYPGQFHSLTCLVQFSHPTATSSIQWYYNGNRIYPKMDTKIYENSKLSILDNHLKLKNLYTDIQTKWINQTTLASRLNIGKLTKYNSGIWSCRKIPGTQLESVEESSINLHTTGSKMRSTEAEDPFDQNLKKSSSSKVLFSSINLHFLIFLHCIFHNMFPICINSSAKFQLSILTYI